MRIPIIRAAMPSPIPTSMAINPTVSVKDVSPLLYAAFKRTIFVQVCEKKKSLKAKRGTRVRGGMGNGKKRVGE